MYLQNYQRHLTSRTYDQEDFGRIGGDEEVLPLEQMRDAGEVEQPAEQSGVILRRSGRKRKAPMDEEVNKKCNK